MIMELETSFRVSNPSIFFCSALPHNTRSRLEVTCPQENNISQIQDGASAATTTATSSASTSNRRGYPSPSSCSSASDATFNVCSTASSSSNAISAQRSTAKRGQNMGAIMECSRAEEGVLKLDTGIRFWGKII